MEDLVDRSSVMNDEREKVYCRTGTLAQSHEVAKAVVKLKPEQKREEFRARPQSHPNG